MLVALASAACGREDVELAPSVATPNPTQDCSAAVPAELLGARPPMGWNGYNAFQCSTELDEAKVKANAEALIESGMQSAGYRYVNLDTCWQLPRTADGQRPFVPEKLPSGIASLSEWLHARELSFGMYSLIRDCFNMPGGDGYWLVRELRTRPPAAGGAIPAVAITAHGETHGPDRTLAAGFAAHLRKPIDPWELCRVVATLCRRV